MIRPATDADIPRIVGMVQKLRAAINGPQEVCPIWTGQSLARLIHSPDAAVWVSEGGFIAGELGQTLISPDLIAQEHGWWSDDRTGRALKAEYEAWAKSRGATLTHISCVEGPVKEMLERDGYRPAETAMVK